MPGTITTSCRRTQAAVRNDVDEFAQTLARDRARA